MELAEHFDHNIEIAKYSNHHGQITDYSVECVSCNEVIIVRKA